MNTELFKVLYALIVSEVYFLSEISIYSSLRTFGKYESGWNDLFISVLAKSCPTKFSVSMLKINEA